MALDYLPKRVVDDRDHWTTSVVHVIVEFHAGGFRLRLHLWPDNRWGTSTCPGGHRIVAQLAHRSDQPLAQRVGYRVGPVAQLEPSRDVVQNVLHSALRVG